MSSYVLGLDGGGTKTAVCVMNPHGEEISAFQCGAVNYNSVPILELNQNISEIMQTAAFTAGGLENCAAVCIGAAGISNPEAVRALQSAVDSCGYNGRLVIKGDHETALFGALQKGTGAILISGTGSICYGINKDGQAHRTGGRGHIIDDEGSGYDIGRSILSEVIKSCDGRSGKTALRDMVFERLHASSAKDIVSYVYREDTGKKEIAAFAPLLTEACEKKDPAALKIKDIIVAKLESLAVPVIEKLELENDEIALTGSILQKDCYIKNSLVQRLLQLFPSLRVTQAKRSAAFGAAMIALQAIKKE